jgi:hypothetical protein
MPRVSFPPGALGLDESRFAHEYEMFSRWLHESGYSSKNVRDHLSRLRQVLEHSAEAVPDGKRSAQYIHRRFGKYCISPWFIKGYRATERAYDKFLDSQQRLHPIQSARRSQEAFDTGLPALPEGRLRLE